MRANQEFWNPSNFGFLGTEKSLKVAKHAKNGFETIFGFKPPVIGTWEMGDGSALRVEISQ